MTRQESSTHIATELRALAQEVAEYEQTVIDFEVSDHLMGISAQLRFVAILTESAHDGFYDTMGLAWVTAGRHFLDAVERARMDAVHESRAKRRDDRGLALADTLAWITERNAK